MNKEYIFPEGLKKNQIVIEGDMMHVSGKYGGSININSILSVIHTPWSLTRISNPKGSLFFKHAGGELGVMWDPLTPAKLKQVESQAEEIAAYVQQRIANKTNDNQTVIQNIKTELSPADEVKKLKELLDMEAITQEEFDKKKKELLGL